MPERDPNPLVSGSADPEMQELIDYFVGELPTRIDSLEKAAEAEDLEALRVIAHQLKGAAAGYGFPSIGDAAKVLEECLRNADPTEGSVDRVRAELEALVALCRSYCRSQ